MTLAPEVRTYLEKQYAGILTQDQLEKHIETYIGLDTACSQVDSVAEHLAPNSKLLDVGSGFGSFVLAARHRGYEAIGLEIVPFEVEFARNRLRTERPQDNPEDVYRVGDGLGLPFADVSFDGITLWNVVEHVTDYRQLLAEAFRVLRPNGILILVCPNYFAIRDEAHYHVLWPSLLPKPLGSRYLRLRGKDPTFFEQHIHYCTNWGILRAARKLGFRPEESKLRKLDDPSLFRNEKVRAGVNLLVKSLGKERSRKLASAILATQRANPIKPVVSLALRKEVSTQRSAEN